MKHLKEKFMTPILSVKREYMPLLMVYFSAAFMGISSVTQTFFIKNNLTLSAAEFASIGIWVALPWSIKFIFGAFIDSISIAGNNRKSYMVIGALLMSLGTAGWATLSSNSFMLFGQYGTVLLSNFLIQLGVVFMDLTADTMCVDVVPEGPDRHKELALVQVLGKLSFQIGALVAALFTGWIATHIHPTHVFLGKMLVPLIGISGLLFSDTPKIEPSPINKRIFIEGGLFAILVVFANFVMAESMAQLFVFGISISYILYLMRGIITEIPLNKQNIFIRACLGIFLFRCVPYAGDGIQWWLIESVGLTQMDFGTLRQISYISSLAVTWFIADLISKASIKRSLLALAALDVVFQVPELIVYFNLHNAIGVSAKSIIYVTTAMTSPIGGLSMIPLGVLIAQYAPSTKRAFYFAVTASLMNIALQFGSLLTKYMNEIWTVTRTNFDNLGILMLIVLVFSVIFPISGIITIKEDR